MAGVFGVCAEEHGRGCGEIKAPPGAALPGSVGGHLSVSWGWHSKRLLTVWLNAMEMYSHSSGDQKSTQGRVIQPAKGLSLLLDSGASRYSPGLQAYHSSFCLPIQMAPSPPCGFVFVCVSLIRALALGFRAHLPRPG